jgi:SAM-dependent methyltransferase
MTEHPNSCYGGKRILAAMHGAVRYSETIFSEIRAAMPPGAERILDFGAGDRAFVDKFAAHGIVVECVEPDAQLRSSLQASSIKVASDVAELDAATFDFVYTINVLEHIEDIDRACAGLDRVIRPNGTLFVFVPAFEMLWTSLDDEVGHVRRFTRAGLKAVLERAGFHIEQVRFFDSLGFPALLGVRLLERINMFRFEAGNIGLYDQYLFPVSRRLDALGRHILGKNLIAVARRA